MQINISDKVEKKLREVHDGVTKKEVYECFLNMDGKALKDNREQNKTTPPTLWFVAETNKGRKLKICTIIRDGAHHIKTAYDANDEEIRIYEKYGH